MILAVLWGEGELHNRHCRRGRKCWPIQPKSEQPQTEGESDLLDLIGEVTRTLQPTKLRTSWISQETWSLVDRRAALQQAHRVNSQEVRQARWKFQRSLRGNIQKWVRELGEVIETILATDQNHEEWKRIVNSYRKVSGGGGRPHLQRNTWIALQQIGRISTGADHMRG